ncbi:MAG: viral A-type inclusion protein [Bacteroidota bacterium]|nr:viral A-type inclusion protein [Bacteroidota bacterium]
MKRIILPFAILFMMGACNNTDKKQDKNSGHTNSGNEPATLADSLMKEIDDGHIAGMSKIGKLHNTKKQVQAVIDSIGKLPAKAQQSAAPYIAKLQALVKDLEYADFGMDKWMTEFEMDSAINNMEQRIKYLADEKMKVGKMKEAILNGLQKADSLLRAKF